MSPEATIDQTATEPATAPRTPGGPAVMLDQIELPLEVRLGKEVWSLERVLGLRVGDAVPVGPDGEDVVTLLVQDRPYAIGELVIVEGRFAFRVRELLYQDGGA